MPATIPMMNVSEVFTALFFFLFFSQPRAMTFVVMAGVAVSSGGVKP